MPSSHQTPRVDDREDREQPLPVESVRCPGCDTSRSWKRFDAPPEDVNALGTCPDCGIHILGFDTITNDDREELSAFLSSVIGGGKTTGDTYD